MLNANSAIFQLYCGETNCRQMRNRGVFFYMEQIGKETGNIRRRKKKNRKIEIQGVCPVSRNLFVKIK